jgi:AraC-like DNA-binding protein
MLIGSSGSGRAASRLALRIFSGPEPAVAESAARGYPHHVQPSYTVSGASVAALLAHARGRGVDLSDAVAEVGLAGRDLAAPEERVEVAANDHLWREAASRSRDPDFGLRFAERLDLDAFHLVGHLAASSRTLGEALERIVAFSRLLHDAGRTELEREGELARFYPGCRGLPARPPRHVAEFVTASAVLLGRAITQRPWVPVAVAFEHPPPPSVAGHERVFGRVPEFRALETCLVLDGATLALPVAPRPATSVGKYLESYGQALLEALGPSTPDDLEGQVLRALASGLQSGAVGIDPVARRLGLSSRTLQRRLAESGTRFADLVDRARRTAAERYLADGVLPLAEIGYLLGFADPSNFHRAFRRWTGVTPGEYARRSRSGAAPAG